MSIRSELGILVGCFKAGVGTGWFTTLWNFVLSIPRSSLLPSELQGHRHWPLLAQIRCQHGFQFSLSIFLTKE